MILLGMKQSPRNTALGPLDGSDVLIASAPRWSSWRVSINLPISIFYMYYRIIDYQAAWTWPSKN